MLHEPNSHFFYSSYNVEATHIDDQGSQKSVIATAFIIDIGKGTPWIVINRHVVDYMQPTPKYKNFKLSSFVITGRKSDDSQYSLKLHADASIYFYEDNGNDVALIQARIYFESGNESLHWHFGIEQLAGEEEYISIHPFDLIFFTGFPDQHDKLGNRPILRSGRIASNPKYDYSWKNDARGKCVAYEGFSSGGASGSPVFAPPRGMHGIPNSRNGYLIGINAGHISDGNEHSGISYFYKSTTILDIIKKYELMPN